MHIRLGVQMGMEPIRLCKAHSEHKKGVKERGVKLRSAGGADCAMCSHSRACWSVLDPTPGHQFQPGDWLVSLMFRN